jgi:ATP-dependent DNA helicase PIF1
VVLGGDFRQILPVIPKGTRQEIVHTTINSSSLWDFCEVLTLTTNMRLLHGSYESDIQKLKTFAEWILGIGDGSIGEINDVDILFRVLDDLLIPSYGDPLASIVNSTYPDFLRNMDNQSYFKDRAILAPTNAIFEQINDYILDLMPGDEKTCLCCDSPCSANSAGGGPSDVHTPEFLNTITSSGLPNHVLKLKVGVPVMLLRNIDQNLGLCNGT